MTTVSWNSGFYRESPSGPNDEGISPDALAASGISISGSSKVDPAPSTFGEHAGASGPLQSAPVSDAACSGITSIISMHDQKFGRG